VNKNASPNLPTPAITKKETEQDQAIAAAAVLVQVADEDEDSWAEDGDDQEEADMVEMEADIDGEDDEEERSESLSESGRMDREWRRGVRRIQRHQVVTIAPAVLRTQIVCAGGAPSARYRGEYMFAESGNPPRGVTIVCAGQERGTSRLVMRRRELNLLRQAGDMAWANGCSGTSHHPNLVAMLGVCYNCPLSGASALANSSSTANSHNQADCTGSAEPVFGYVMEQCESTLQQRLKDRASSTMSTQQRRHIAWGVLNALVHLHRRGTVHGRLSPEHVWITREGRAKVGRYYSVVDDDGSDGPKKSSPYRVHLAPEQQHGVQTPKADVYAFGCLLVQLFSEAGDDADFAFVARDCLVDDINARPTALLLRDRLDHWRPKQSFLC
jgi:hypothetical protein